MASICNCDSFGGDSKKHHPSLQLIIHCGKRRETSNECIPKNIVADVSKIQQVFQNLLTNSLKFSQQHIRPEIIISCTEKPTYWQFAIKDNGIGIAPEFQEKIFGMFKRLHSSHEFEGTGIGLALVKKIIEQHQGKIWLESEVNQGTNFFFTIPKNPA